MNQAQDLSSLHHCIIIGENANVTRSYEFALRIKLSPDLPPLQASTIMTPEEYEVVHRVVSRLYVEFEKQRRELGIGDDW